MDVRSAELTKYAANAMLATKISFMNEIANLAERLGADVEKVRRGIGSDPRIGYHFLYPGRRLRRLVLPEGRAGADRHRPRGRLRADDARAPSRTVNDAPEDACSSRRSAAHFGGELAGKTFALWGLAFKPNTDDMREAPSRVVMEALWAAGAEVQAYDPEAMDEARAIYGDRADLVLCGTTDAALEGADALVVVTEWHEFRSPDFDAASARS